MLPSVKKLILLLALPIMVCACVCHQTQTVIFKPNENEQGYILEIPASLTDTFVTSGLPECYCRYGFTSRDKNEMFFISNDEGARFDGITSETRSSTKEERSTTRQGYSNEEENYYKHPRFSKIVHVTTKTASQMEEDSNHLMVHYSYVNYGYYNVRQKDKRMYERALKSVKILTDSTIRRDSISILWKPCGY